MPPTEAFHILPQPDETTCGPTCLHAVYGYYADPMPLDQVIAEIPMLRGGGTLAALLACHALRRGYRATLYTYNIELFDPTWFLRTDVDLREKLLAQRRVKRSRKLRAATDAYLEFLSLGGSLRFEDLTVGLLARYLRRRVPVLTGLSATYLYRDPREIQKTNRPDDVRGEPSGHFVVVSGYVAQRRCAVIADPLHPNPMSRTRRYEVPIERLICSVLLGILTYDANLLVVEPEDGEQPPP